MLLRIAVVVCCLVGLVGCSGDGEKKSALSAKTRGPIIATINGKEIGSDRFEKFLELKRSTALDEKRREHVLDQYLQREALAMVIEQEGLLDNGLVQEELQEFKKEMLISRYFEKFLADQVTEQAVSNYYNTKAAEYEQKKAHVAHILIRLNKEMSEQERQARLTSAQEAYSKIRSGEDFAAIAEMYSEDKISAKKGGDLAWIKEGSIDKRFSQTVFTMQEGEVTGPFETVFGFHIVKLLEAPQTVKQPFKEVAGDIRYQLRNQAKQTEMDRLLQAIVIEKKKGQK